MMLRRKKKSDNDNENKKSKFNNKKVTYNGIVFDSKAEADFYQFLIESKVNPEDIIIQPVFVLQERYQYNGKKILPITYKADFQVRDNVYDVKGMITEVAKIKFKIFKKIYPELNLILVQKAARYMTGRNWVTVAEYSKLKQIYKKQQIKNTGKNIDK